MRILTNLGEFDREVGMIWDYYLLVDLGLPCGTSLVGDFYHEALPELLNLCEFQREFHIVTFTGGGLILNFCDHSGVKYKLADGNADPEIILDYRHEIDWVAMDFQRKFGKRSRLP